MEKNNGDIIRFPGLQKKLDGISRSSIDRWEKAKLFPPRIRLGKNSIGWRLDLVEQWLQERSNSSQEV